MSELIGGCFCGAIRYRITAEPAVVTHCHCPSCRRASGAAFITWITVPSDGFEITQGEQAFFHSSPGVNRGFCGNCGSTLSYCHDDFTDEIDITAATLDDPEAVIPDDHIWAKERLAWVKVSDGLPQLDGSHWEHGYPERNGPA